MKKQQILKALHIGDGIAEYEAENLKNYFVSTLEWEKIIEGKSDLILGSKGCGKSALYVNLINESASLRERGILLIPVERPRGNPAFELLGKVGIGSRENRLIADEDNFERKIIGIWKLFLVIVMAKALQDEQNKQKKGKRLFQVLEDENLLPQKFDLGEYLALAIDVIGNGLSESKVEDFTGVLTGMKWSIDFQSRILKKKNQYYISIDELLDDLNEIAENLNLNIWIAIDRLDMAFSEDPHLEEVALRTLIRVYIDCLSLKRLQFKIFLRDDIWQKITTAHQKPLREHSHIRDTSISWEKEKLLNLVVR